VIDQWIDQDAWPTEIQEAVGQFQQGDLVERPAFFYIATARHGIWRLTRAVGDHEADEELFELDPSEAAPYGMITTETCDLVEEDGVPRQPWISIAPVYRIDNLDANVAALLADNRIGYMRKLPAERFAADTWVVDVRIEFPFEKSWLVGRSPIAAFSQPSDRSMLAEFLAGRRNRAILGNEVHTALLTNVRRWIESRAKRGRLAEVLGGVAEVRLAVSGDPLRPDGVALIVIGRSADLVPSAVQESWGRNGPAGKLASMRWEYLCFQPNLRLSIHCLRAGI
jgi:hypothetical protein